MTMLLENQLSKKCTVSVRTLFFFVCFYIYVWKIIQPELIYYSFGVIAKYPHFSKGWMFFRELFSRPFGPVEYISGFLSHLLYFSWLGALILTLTSCLIYSGTLKLLELAGAGKVSTISYIPVLLVLAIFNHYGNSMQTCVSFAGALWVSVLNEKLFVKDSIVSIVAFFVLFLLLYYIAGGASFVFLVIAVLFSILIRRQVVIGGCILFLGTALFWLFGVHLTAPNTIQSIYKLFPFIDPRWPSRHVLALCLYLFVPACLLLIGIWKIIFKRRTIAKDTSVDSMSRKKNPHRYPKPKWAFGTLILAVMFSAMGYYSFAPVKKNICKMVNLDRQEKWSEQIKHIRQLPIQEYNLYYNHCLNKALYHTGQLGEDMFSYPQNKNSFLLGLESRGLGQVFREFIACDTFIRLGQINLAEKKAHEHLENAGEHHHILKMMVLINIVKDQPETAQMYLKVLSKDLIHNRWAKDVLNKLDTDLRLSTDTQVQHLRSVKLDSDAFLADNQTEKLLSNLLIGNKLNKMAFEYLMAYNLITGRLDKIVANIPRFNDFGYKTLPRHYEEAILTYQSINKVKVDLHGHKIRPETVIRFKDFEKRYSSYDDRLDAGRALRGQFRNCYYYYYSFFGTELIP